MRKTFIHILTVFMAVLVFYGGAGINIISYCCKECRAAGIEVLINEKCCDIHNHNHEQTHSRKQVSSTLCCEHTAHTGDSHTKHPLTSDNCCNPELIRTYSENADECCNLTRIDFDWSFHNTAELDIDFSPDVYDLFFNNPFSNPSAHISLICENNMAMPNGPPLVLPNDYLSLLTVLLI